MPIPIRLQRQIWCVMTESNCRPPPCRGGALPTELITQVADYLSYYTPSAKARAWWQRLDSNQPHTDFQSAALPDELRRLYGGSGEIRTHGPLRIDSFQDCCHKPDSTTLPLIGAPEETRTPKIWLLRPTRIPIPSPGQCLEHRVRFELTNQRICNPRHWAALVPVH